MPTDDLCRDLVNAAPDAILACDAAGIITFWNAGAERIFGFARDEAIGRSLDILIPPTLRERHWSGWTQTIRTGQTRYGAGDLLAVPALRKDGARISVEFCIIPFRNEAQVIVGMGAIMRDVTKRFEEMKALRKRLAAQGAPTSQT